MVQAIPLVSPHDVKNTLTRVTNVKTTSHGVHTASVRVTEPKPFRHGFTELV